MDNILDIQLEGHNGNTYSAFRKLDENAHRAPACVFGDSPDEWVPVAIAYAYALAANGAEATWNLIEEAAGVIVNTTEEGTEFHAVLDIIGSTAEGRDLLATYTF